VVKYQDNAFTSDDSSFYQIANQVAIAVENALAFWEIRELKDKLAQEKLYLEDEIRSEMEFRTNRRKKCLPAACGEAVGDGRSTDSTCYLETRYRKN